MSNNNMKKRILFLCQQYEPYPKALELCVIRVQESLLKMGIKSDVLEIAGEERGLIKKNEFGNVYSIGAADIKLDTTRKSVLKSLLYKISIAFKWPLVLDKNACIRFKSYINKLKSKYNYDAIIGAAYPYDADVIGSCFDRYIFYELDNISNNPEYKRGLKKLYKFKLKRIENEIYERSDLIIHMEHNRKYLSRCMCQDFERKSIYADIPNLVENKMSSEVIQSNHDTLYFAYFGALVKDYRNPTYLIDLVVEISKKVPIKCDFYSRGNCEDILKDASINYSDVIFQCGYVDKETVSRKQEEVDMLVSIGNKLTGDDYSLPSKIIEYIGLGKPILHINGGENDSAISYLDKYKLACIINPNDDICTNANKVIDFIRLNKGKTIPFEDLKKNYKYNSPDYTADIIYRFIMDNKRDNNE